MQPVYTPRLAQPEDLARVIEIVHAAYTPWIAVIGRQPMPMTADYPTLIGQQFVYVVAGAQEAPIVAVLVLWPLADHVYIDNLAVHPDVQRQGLGALLLKFAEAHAREQGFGTLRLLTNGKMVSNQAYYRAHGYTELRRETTPDGGSVVWMEKHLSEATGSLT